MISYRSIYYCVLINSFIASLASLQYYLNISSIVASPLKLIILYTFISFVTRNKPRIAQPSTPFSFPIVAFCANALIDAAEHSILLRSATQNPLKIYWIIPYLFLFEIVFDFFHYWTHRMCHVIPFLYRHVHRFHHSIYPIETSITFLHHPLDLLITNFLPLVVSMWICPLDAYTVTLMMWYKSLQEIAGHTGKVLKGSSFTPCIWIPKWFGISLYSCDHELHHRFYGYNFSKRFSLWDKVFGTFYCKKKGLEQLEK
jgi:sterol desaturase/sphingolipid hydroxylase (fatty acid hydroxylase superfamily)